MTSKIIVSPANSIMAAAKTLLLALACLALLMPAAGRAEDSSIGCVDYETDYLLICKCTIEQSTSCQNYCLDVYGINTCGEESRPECEAQCLEKSSGTGAVAEPLRTRGLENPLQSATIPDLFGRVIRMFTGLVGSFALLMFVYGGLLWVTSRGNAEQVEKGKRIFTWSTIGLAIIFSAYLILRLLFQTIGATN